MLLKTVIEERNPKTIGIDRSTVFAFTDGLSSGEFNGMSGALGSKWTAKFKDAEGLPLVCVEAMLSNCALAATKHAGIPECVEDGKTGYLVDERDELRIGYNQLIWRDGVAQVCRNTSILAGQWTARVTG